MSKNRFTLHKDHTKILEVIKKNIDDEGIEKRQTLEKLLNKMSVKFYKSKLHWDRAIFSTPYYYK